MARVQVSLIGPSWSRRMRTTMRRLWAGSYWSYGYAGFLETGDTERLDLFRGTSVSVAIRWSPIRT